VFSLILHLFCLIFEEASKSKAQLPKPKHKPKPITLHKPESGPETEPEREPEPEINPKPNLTTFFCGLKLMIISLAKMRLP
jgi:hypothetical protein